MSGLMDLIVVLVILVIVFGAKWIPAMGAALGRMLARRAARRAGRTPADPTPPVQPGPP